MYLLTMNKVKCSQFLFYYTGTARFLISAILLSGYDSDGNYERKLKIINSDKIVGLARPFWDKTWLDVLSNEYCHKNRDFELFNAETFNDVLLHEQADGYPTVVKYKRKYYISGNGLHRLTIAKCIGNKKVKVVVEKQLKNKK